MKFVLSRVSTRLSRWYEWTWRRTVSFLGKSALQQNSPPQEIPYPSLLPGNTFLRGKRQVCGNTAGAKF